MTVRETLNRRPWATGAFFASAVVLLAMIGLHACGGPPKRAAGPGKAFFTVDDGKTWFADDATKLPPFDHEGKTAYRAQVFRCGTGEAFVGFMESYSSENQKQLQAAVDSHSPDLVDLESELHAMVKKPGDARWVTFSPGADAEYRKVLLATCPDGSGNPAERVDPNR
jgi:hypothetical protein